MTIFPTTKDVVTLHDEITKETGGHTGIISYGNLDFIIEQMQIPKTIERQAAVLFFGILTSHPFVDGNKRTALIATETFLRNNRKEFTADEKDIWDILHKIADGKMSFEEAILWLKDKIK